MNIEELQSEYFGRYTLSNGQYLRSNEFPIGNDDDIIIHKNKETLDTYHRLFQSFTPETIFEIGVKEGGSLVLWSDLFDCKVVGIDNDIKQLSNAYYEYIYGRDVTVIHADCYQLDKVDAALRRHFTEPIDLIVDDCQHTLDQICMNFESHYPKLSYRGLYVIEDWYALHKTHRKEMLLSVIDVANKIDNSSIRQYPSMVVVNKLRYE